MLLKSLQLNNIRSYLEEELSFPEGSSLLSGDIGAGKSTILMAVEFALFGIMRAELSGNSLLRNGKNSGYVELAFEIDKKNVAVKRTLKRQQGTVKQDAGSIVIDGIHHDMTPQELKSKVISLIGYPGEMLTSAKSLIFRYTVYTPQEEMKKIVFDNSRERLNTLRKIFGIDKYSTMVSNAEIFAKKIGEEKRVLSERIADLDEKTSQRKKTGDELEVLSGSLGRIVPEIKKASEALAQKISNAEEQEKKFNESVAVMNELKVLEAKLSEKELQAERNARELEVIEKEMALLEKRSEMPEVAVEDLRAELEREEKAYIEKLSELSALKSRRSEMQERINLLKNEISDFEIKISRISSGNERLEKIEGLLAQRQSVEGKIESARNTISALKGEIAAGEAWKKTAEELRSGIDSMDKCPLCMQSLFPGQKEQIKEEQERKISGLGSSLEHSRAKMAALEEELKESEKKAKELFELEKEAQRINGEVAGLKPVEQSCIEKKALLASMTENLALTESKIKNADAEKIGEQIKSRKELLKKAEESQLSKKSIAEKSALREKLGREKSEIAGLVSSLKSGRAELARKAKLLESSSLKLADARKKVEQCREALKETEMRKLSVEKDIENREAIAKSLDEEIREKTVTKEYMQALGERQSWLKEKFIHFVKLVESHIMQKVHEEFDSNFRQWVSVLLEDESLNAKLDEDFAPSVEQNGFEMDIADLSGGEKTSFALAYRLALNKVINDVLSAIRTKDILILDEPTDGFSSEQLDRMRDVLEQLNIRQTIIVSHEPKLESFVSSIIRIEKSHHVSRALA